MIAAFELARRLFAWLVKAPAPIEVPPVAAVPTPAPPIPVAVPMAVDALPVTPIPPDNPALTLALRLIRAFEGCKLRAYQDIVGVWTICFGSTNGVKDGMVKSQTQCDLLLASEAGGFMLRVLQLCPTLAKNPNRLAAVTSFAYNLGLGALKASTLRRKCLANQWGAASAEFPKWNKAGGIPVRGLTIRRAAERKTFDS